MDLLVFAHRGEAACWLDQQGWKFYENNYQLKIYTHEKNQQIILLCGEGQTKAMSHTMLAVMALQAEYTLNHIINIGVAATIDKNQKLGVLIPVGTVYSQGLVGGFEFESIVLDSSIESTCLSVHERVVHEQEHSSFLAYSEIIDREAWAVAYAAKKLKLKTKCFKYLIDRADQEGICEWTKDHSEELSNKLFDAYQSLMKQERVSSKLQVASLGTYAFLVNKFGLHVSKSQKDQLNKQIDELMTSQNIKPLDFVDKINKNKELSGLIDSTNQKKQKTKILVSYFDRWLHPIKAACYNQAKELFDNVQSQGVQVIWDQKLESELLKITAQIRSQKDIEKAKSALGGFDFSKWQDVISGKHIDV